jgi:hypothetical protein
MRTTETDEGFEEIKAKDPKEAQLPAQANECLSRHINMLGRNRTIEGIKFIKSNTIK